MAHGFSQFWDTRWPLIPLLALTCLVYSPGLSGGFLFDDFANLDALASYVPGQQWSLIRYLTSGNADPIGRPLSLATFLLSHGDFPGNARSFLIDNLIIHLINGTLLFALIRRLGHSIAGDKNASARIALLASALWLLHPLFVSTTLYPVQREAMLPATFVIAGLICYSVGRQRFSQSSGSFGLTWMVSGIAVGTLLAALSKANGLLLPLLALCLEVTVFRARQASLSPTSARKLNLTVALVLVLPSLLIVAYTASFAFAWNTTPSVRDWTIGERIMTEPRILIEYLHLLLVPQSVSSGLFNENYPVSRGWLHPASTAVCAAAILALLLIAWRIRRSKPALSGAALFYFAGHLLESGPVPLELYYEHRNYLPAMLLFWPLAVMLETSARSRSTKSCLAVAIIAVLAFTTFQRASVWGNPAKLAASWVATNPDSSRAQVMLATIETNQGRERDALSRIDFEWSRKPSDLQLAFGLVAIACDQRMFDSDIESRVAFTLRSTRNGTGFINPWMTTIINELAGRKCPGLELHTAKLWIHSALQNPLVAIPSFRNEEIEPLLGLLALREGQPQFALAHFNASLEWGPTPDIAARQAASLAAAGYYQEALSHLDNYDRVKSRSRRPAPGMATIHRWVIAKEGYWPRELSRMREKLLVEIAASPAQDGRMNSDRQ